jgi:hypothetical protein
MTRAQAFARNSVQKGNKVRNMPEGARIPGDGPAPEVLRSGLLCDCAQPAAAAGSPVCVGSGAQAARSKPGSAAEVEGVVT